MRRAGGLALVLLLGLLGLLLWRAAAPLPAEPEGIAGEVRDAGGPVAGARVRLKGTERTALTGADGRFHLPGPFSRSDRVTAWKDGSLIAGAPADRRPLTLTLAPLPQDDCERYGWVDPSPDPAGRHNCANCHGEIYREWSAGGHARSVSSRRFRNLYDGTDWHGNPNAGWSLLAEHPDGAGVCTACHAPTVPFDDPGYYDLRQVRGVAAQGVHCDYCHKVAGTSGEPGLTHGRFGLKLLRPAEGQLFFGPLDDVDRGEDAHSPLYRHSRYCASCHEGTVFGVPVYTTYSEWLASPARREGKHCQTCHMAPTGRLTNIAPGKGGIDRDPATLGNHRFFAGSQEDMLRRCLHLTATPVPDGDGVRLNVEVRAEDVGHRVPTGFVDHHLLLAVEAVDAAGNRVAAHGGPVLPDVAGKELAGQPGRLYARLLKDFDGKSPAPFWRADPDAEDTRLVPGQPDRVRFVFPSQSRRFRVRLLYRRFWQEVAEVKGWPDNEVVVQEQWAAKPQAAQRGTE
jgi:Cytochrome c554 and c-prime